MTATHGLGTYGNAVGTVTPLDHKMAQLSLIVKTAANTIRPGLFWDGSPTIVSGKANMSYDVRAYSCVTSRGANAGAVIGTNDAVYNVATTAAPGSNSRYDVVYHWPREFSIDGVDSNPVIGVIQGTAAASPTVPSLAAFPGAIALATILVPAGVTATNSGTTITQTAPFTAVDGGTVVTRTTTERNLYVPARTDARAFNLADSVEYTWNGTAWVDKQAKSHAEYTFNRSAIADGAITLFTTTQDATNTNDTAFTTIPGSTGQTITVVTAGIYAIDFYAQVAAVPTGRFALLMSISGRNLAADGSPSGENTMSIGVGNVYLPAGTVISFQVTKTTGGSHDVTSRICITKIASL